MSSHVVCTLATQACEADLKVFLFTITLYNTGESMPKIYLLCDDYISQLEIVNKNPNILVFNSLEKYGPINRKLMERTQGNNYKTLWEDFMMEKTAIMDKALTDNKSVFFTDCDICVMGPLPDIPSEYKLALSPHEIRPADEQKFGRFNAGFLWTSEPTMPELWRQASTRSRYYDQAALEELQTAFPTYIFPSSINYGWWRMYQSILPHDKLQADWKLFRTPTTSGIKVKDNHLLSIHTHMLEKQDLITILFNKFVISRLKVLAAGKQKNAQLFLNFLANELKIDI